MPGPGQDFYSMAWSALTEPVYGGLDGIGGIALEWMKSRRSTWHQYNDPAADDESVASFLERRLKSWEIGDNIVSAVLHGIYAGDIYQLSARSLLPKPWYNEALHGSLTQAMLEGLKTRQGLEDYDSALLKNELQGLISQPMREKLGKHASVYTFKEGIGALSKKLESTLRANNNVQFKTGSSEKVTGIGFDAQTNSVTVSIPLISLRES
jgi:oxygen-dependent protoporphyrinogen oxidase